MKSSVYIESTIPSYLAADPSRDLHFLADQQATREWWDLRRPEFDLYISEAVLAEVSAGDPGAAGRRLDVLKDIPILDATPEADRLAAKLLAQMVLPAKAAIDAQHIAIAVVNGLDYLLTWNCTHIANATLRGRIESICRSSGFTPTIIRTPPELLKEPRR